mmetsp:Transcript_35181/g.88652  ORF Transcript_35181/g.88652 Transcript_35181/m.88652 type:complete len:293 (-) Transcript_35181:498-1376(-)
MRASRRCTSPRMMETKSCTPMSSMPGTPPLVAAGASPPRAALRGGLGRKAIAACAARRHENRLMSRPPRGSSPSEESLCKERLPEASRHGPSSNGGPGGSALLSATPSSVAAALASFMRLRACDNVTRRPSDRWPTPLTSTCFDMSAPVTGAPPCASEPPDRSSADLGVPEGDRPATSLPASVITGRAEALAPEADGPGKGPLSGRSMLSSASRATSLLTLVSVLRREEFFATFSRAPSVSILPSAVVFEARASTLSAMAQYRVSAAAGRLRRTLRRSFSLSSHRKQWVDER